MKLAEKVGDFGGKYSQVLFDQKSIAQRDGDAKIPPRDSSL